MKEQENQIFRKKAMDQLSAPDQLMDYLRVTGPGIWMILIGIIVLLGGILVWGVVGRINTTVTVPAQVENGIVRCYVLQDDMKDADSVIEVTIGDQEMQASTEDAQIVTMDTANALPLYETGYLKAGKNVMVLTCETELKDGFYQADLTTETLKPISLLFSKNS